MLSAPPTNATPGAAVLSFPRLFAATAEFFEPITFPDDGKANWAEHLIAIRIVRVLLVKTEDELRTSVAGMRASDCFDETDGYLEGVETLLGGLAALIATARLRMAAVDAAANMGGAA